MSSAAIELDLPSQHLHGVAHLVDQSDALFLLLRRQSLSSKTELQLLPSPRVAAVAADEQSRHAKLAREIGHGVAFGAVNPVRTEVDTALGPDPAAYPPARLEDDDLPATAAQGTRRGESG